MSDPREPKPLFRRDLDVTQTEHEGVRAFTVRDDVTGESFRMYEVEYALAQQIDGSRDMLEIIAHAKATLGATLTESDLLTFLRQLAERGFLRNFVDPQPIRAEVPAQDQDLTQTATLHGETVQGSATAPAQTPRPPAPAPAPMDADATQASPNDAVAAGAYALVTQELDLARMAPTPALAVDPDELGHLLRDAIHRMVEDDVRGAATILHAAQALAPQDGRLQKLVEATQVARQSGTPAARAQLRERGATLYPELMPQPLGTHAGADTRPDTGPGAPVRPKARRRRGVAAGIALALLLVGGAAALWRWRNQAPVWVVVREVGLVPHQQTSPPASALAPQVADTLHFAKAGVVAQVLPAGTRVQAQQVVARQRLPERLRGTMEAAQAQARAAEAGLSQLLAARTKLTTERRVLQRQVAALRQAGNVKLAAKLTARLRLCDRRERQVRAALVGAQSRRTQANAALAAQEEQAAGYLLRASCACTVGADGVVPGTPLAAGAPVVTLVDAKRLRVNFELADGASLAVGTAVALKVESLRNNHVPGVVSAVAPGGKDLTAVVVTLEDATALAGLPARAFRLLIADAAQAARVPRSSIVRGGAQSAADEAHVWALEAGHLQRRDIVVLDAQSSEVWVAPKRLPWAGQSLPLVITAQGQALAGLREGALAAPVSKVATPKPTAMP